MFHGGLLELAGHVEMAAVFGVFVARAPHGVRAHSRILGRREGLALALRRASPRSWWSTEHGGTMGLDCDVGRGGVAGPGGANWIGISGA